MSVPAGYKKAPGSRLQASAEQSVLEPEAPSSKPQGYKRRALKHDETNPRPPRFAGRPKVCQLCYRSHPTFIDHVCRRCMKDWAEVEMVEREMAKLFPATARLTRPQVFRKLWENYLALRVQVKKLRARL